jgi:hypothetical protein
MSDIKLPRLVYEYTPTVRRRTHSERLTDTHEVEGSPQWPVSYC